MKNLSSILLLFLFIFSSPVVFSQNDDSFTIVYNNIPSDKNLKSQWGYSAWIEKDNELILFDTGTKAELFQDNLKKLELDPARISTVAISHDHNDHTGGLESVLAQLKKGTKVYLPNDFNPALKKNFSSIEFILNDKYREIANGVWLTGIFIDSRRGIKEQALVLEKGGSIIMITGCAHPGIVEMCESVKKHFPDKKMGLVTGGFHLMHTPEEEVAQISDKIKQLGFEKVAPSHCTGDKSIAIFKEAWGDNFVQLNLGDTYSF